MPNPRHVKSPTDQGLWAWGADSRSKRRRRWDELTSDPVLYALDSLSMTDSLVVYLHMQGYRAFSWLFCLVTLLAFPLLLVGLLFLLLLRLGAGCLFGAVRSFLRPTTAAVFPIVAVFILLLVGSSGTSPQLALVPLGR